MAGQHELPRLNPETFEYVAARLTPNITSGAYSSVLLADVAHHLERGTENIFAILDEIGALEGAPGSRPSRTKPGERFEHPPLKGLWHKHYQQMSVSSLATNLRNQWGRKRLDKLIREHFQSGQDIPPDIMAGRLAHDAVHGGYTERRAASKLTGEWIVYARHEGANYYLTLGAHGDDDAIATRVRGCASEFPHVPELCV
jgi:hypothetical protein